jgi:hypothetical protein
MAFFSETCRHAMAQSQSTVKFTQWTHRIC